ncbi:MAG: hypothetical protein CMJ61_03270, partial [Planctomycetaceae bacterium]|nr:hypothetical protein [Planctomycetaceae bacterium]
MSGETQAARARQIGDPMLNLFKVRVEGPGRIHVLQAGQVPSRELSHAGGEFEHGAAKITAQIERANGQLAAQGQPHDISRDVL